MRLCQRILRLRGEHDICRIELVRIHTFVRAFGAIHLVLGYVKDGALHKVQSLIDRESCRHLYLDCHVCWIICICALEKCQTAAYQPYLTPRTITLGKIVLTYLVIFWWIELHFLLWFKRHYRLQFITTTERCDGNVCQI